MLTGDGIPGVSNSLKLSELMSSSSLSLRGAPLGDLKIVDGHINVVELMTKARAVCA